MIGWRCASGTGRHVAFGRGLLWMIGERWDSGTLRQGRDQTRARVTKTGRETMFTWLTKTTRGAQGRQNTGRYAGHHHGP